uniref:Sugar transporter SWEET1 n=1 Tax=viral metagenome TaxID=1070528 RepID=A0A6C0M3A5_9ZZZZ
MKKSIKMNAPYTIYNAMNGTVVTNSELALIPYTATSLSVLGRFIFMFLLYKNKSANSLSLLFCFLSIISSSMWIYYSVQMNDTPLVMRSSTEITLLFLSALYIIKNKLVQYQQQRRVLQHVELMN